MEQVALVVDYVVVGGGGGGGADGSGGGGVVVIEKANLVADHIQQN